MILSKIGPNGDIHLSNRGLMMINSNHSLKRFDFVGQVGREDIPKQLTIEEGKEYIGTTVIHYDDYNLSPSISIPNPVELTVVDVREDNVRWKYVFIDKNGTEYCQGSSSCYYFDDFIKWYNEKIIKELNDREELINKLEIQNELMHGLLNTNKPIVAISNDQFEILHKR